jgi:hypothetical protein
MTPAKATLLSRRLLGIDSLRWNAVAPWRAARVTLAIVLPLVIGWLSGHIDYGAYVALGALPAALASFQGETLSRVARCNPPPAARAATPKPPPFAWSTSGNIRR